MVEDTEVNNLVEDRKAEIIEPKKIQNGTAIVNNGNHYHHPANQLNGNVKKTEFEEDFNRNEEIGGSNRRNSTEPPDGGIRAWMVMLGSFFCNGILFGVINSYGVLYAEFHDNLQRQNVTDASGKAALVGSLAMGATFFISPVSGVLTDNIGIRTTTFLGGAIASSGMLLSSFCIDNFVALCITYGVMYGLGGALFYTPSLAVLGHYFKRYLGVVNGIVTAGSSTFTIMMPYIMDVALKQFGIIWTLRLLALMSGVIMLCALLFKPLHGYNEKKKKSSMSDIFNVNLLRNTKYIIWITIIAISLTGYFVPYVFMKKFVKTNFPTTVDNNLPVLCISITSGLGRLVFGYVADLKVNRIFFQQLAYLAIGVFTMLMPLTAWHFPWLIVISLGMGFFDGCFISLIGPIIFDICGRKGATQAIGFMFGVCAIPMTIGPYVAGLIYDRQQDFDLPLVLAGIPPIVGAVLLFLTRCVKSQPNEDDPSAVPMNGGRNFDEKESMDDALDEEA